jgi:hypothetical protein
MTIPTAVVPQQEWNAQREALRVEKDYRFFLEPGTKICDYPEGCPGRTIDWPWYTTADDFSADFDVDEALAGARTSA